MLVSWGVIHVSRFSRQLLVRPVFLILYTATADLWTFPIASVSGFKYYLLILDDCSHYLWTFPLRFKSDTFTTLANFISYARTQFGATVKAV